MEGGKTYVSLPPGAVLNQSGSSTAIGGARAGVGASKADRRKASSKKYRQHGAGRPQPGLQSENEENLAPNPLPESPGTEGAVAHAAVVAGPKKPRRRPGRSAKSAKSKKAAGDSAAAAPTPTPATSTPAAAKVKAEAGGDGTSAPAKAADAAGALAADVKVKAEVKVKSEPKVKQQKAAG